MRFFILLGLLLSLNAYASNDSFNIDDGKKIVLGGDNCPELMQQAEAILAWSLKLNEHQDLELPECYCNQSGSCIVDVYDISPQLVQTYQGVNPEYHGPNCWNRALVSAKILPSLTFSTPKEMTFWMSSPLCRERLIDEEAQPGDIIAIRDYSGEIHGFTYLTDDLAFSKDGYEKEYPYGYESLDSSFNLYKVPQNCRRVYGRPTGGECYYERYANYFTCMSLEEYLSSLNVEVPQEYIDIYERLLEIDAEVFSYIFNKYKEIDRELLDNMKYELHAGNQMARKLLKNPEIAEKEALFWNALERRGSSLFEQINKIQAY